MHKKAKDVTKKLSQFKQKVIESYKKLMVEHEELITDIKEKIKNKRDEIDKIDGKINTKNAQITANNETLKAAKNAAPSQDQIDAAKEANKRLNEEIDELKNERKTAVGDLSILEKKITRYGRAKRCLQSSNR